MVEADGAYRTDDMTLASVLAASGFKYVLERLNSTKAVWVFVCPDGREDDMDDLLDAYEQHGCKVEPRAFIQEFSRVRRELYRLVPPPQRRRTVAPSADQH